MTAKTTVAILGGTGYVGRLLCRRLVDHPDFCVGAVVGSSRSVGRAFKEVWETKEQQMSPPQSHACALATPSQRQRCALPSAAHARRTPGPSCHTTARPMPPNATLNATLAPQLRTCKHLVHSPLYFLQTRDLCHLLH